MNEAEGGEKRRERAASKILLCWERTEQQKNTAPLHVVRHTTQSSGHCLVIAGFGVATLFIFFAIRRYHQGIAQLTPALLFLH